MSSKDDSSLWKTKGRKSLSTKREDKGKTWNDVLFNVKRKPWYLVENDCPTDTGLYYPIESCVVNQKKIQDYAKLLSSMTHAFVSEQCQSDDLVTNPVYSEMSQISNKFNDYPWMKRLRCKIIAHLHNFGYKCKEAVTPSTTNLQVPTCSNSYSKIWPFIKSVSSGTFGSTHKMGLAKGNYPLVVKTMKEKNRPVIISKTMNIPVDKPDEKTTQQIEKTVSEKIYQSTDLELFHELAISFCLNELREKTPCFLFGLGGFYCEMTEDKERDSFTLAPSSKNHAFALFETVEVPLFSNKPSDRYNLQEFVRRSHHVTNSIGDLLIVIAGALQMAQRHCNFMHNDLHSSNVLFRYKPPTMKTVASWVSNGKLKKIQTGLQFVPTIIDYGMSTAVYNGKQLLPPYVSSGQKTKCWTIKEPHVIPSFDFVMYFVYVLHTIKASDWFTNPNSIHHCLIKPTIANICC